jgi:hypothetical protein
MGITMKQKLVIFIAIISTIAVALALGQTGGEQPKITWSSPDVYAGLTSTTTVQKTVTFTSDQALQNVKLETVPEIARFVNIQPATFAAIPKGQPQTVRLTFRAPAGAKFGAYEGTIHVRDGSATRPQTLKTAVTFAVVPLPPDPGEAGKATIAGIDSDRDGVRDDIQRYIALTYPNSAKTRAALSQLAKGIGGLMLSSGKDAAYLKAVELNSAQSCLFYVIGFNTDGVPDDRLESQILNTRERTRAYVSANGNLSGKGFDTALPSEWRAFCQFNPDQMEN